jgi:hypothetical protein
VSDAFEALCARALSLDPRVRHADAAELLSAIDAVLEGTPLPSMPHTVMQPPLSVEASRVSLPASSSPIGTVMAGSMPGSAPQTRSVGRSRNTSLVAIAIAIAAIAVIAIVWGVRSSSSSSNAEAKPKSTEHEERPRVPTQTSPPIDSVALTPTTLATETPATAAPGAGSYATLDSLSDMDPVESSAPRAPAPTSPGPAPVPIPPPPKQDTSPPSTMGKLNINSIPVSRVLVDGRPVGTTPRMGIDVSPGSHTVTFVHEEKGRKVVTVNVKAGETKSVAVKF